MTTTPPPLSLEPTSFDDANEAQAVKESSHIYCHGCALNDVCVTNQIYCEALIELTSLENRLHRARHDIQIILQAHHLD